MYHYMYRLEFPNFQTGIFVEWKVLIKYSLLPPSPLLNQSAFANPRSCQQAIEMELEKSFHFLTGRFLFILFGTPVLWAIFLLYSSAWLSSAKGAFHLSELTCQTSPLVMRTSLLIKTIQPDQSNLKQSPRRRWVFIKNSWKKSISLSK